jgi:hypothetical protein
VQGSNAVPVPVAGQEQLHSVLRQGESGLNLQTLQDVLSQLFDEPLEFVHETTSCDFLLVAKKDGATLAKFFRDPRPETGASNKEAT